MGAYLLDITAPGSNLLASSRRLVHAPKPGTNATPWYQVRLTPDGRTVIAVLAAPNHRDPHGAALLVANTRLYPGKRRAFFILGHVGLLTGHHFTPLPWFTDTLAAAW